MPSKFSSNFKWFKMRNSISLTQQQFFHLLQNVCQDSGFWSHDSCIEYIHLNEFIDIYMNVNEFIPIYSQFLVLSRLLTHYLTLYVKVAPSHRFIFINLSTKCMSIFMHLLIFRLRLHSCLSWLSHSVYANHLHVVQASEAATFFLSISVWERVYQ